MSQDAAEQNIQMWKVKKLIQSLDSARRTGTSMISLIIPPKSISYVDAGIRHSFQHQNPSEPSFCAITRTILTDAGKEKKVSFDFEPHKPINTSLYLCDNKFHTEALSELLESDSRFGFIVMDGNGTLFGIFAGNTREVIHSSLWIC
ncbi:peptide chain release factor eRF1/aRF1 [Lentinula edodes]|uniref:Peptide chain release factor eRF1/aRF1 n=1 Tax=Lentinula lateritia TaxID=40482 RepID=A0A9W9E187_9AGAR|nr:peptide chain release factor eRF1/aRF1 [Lentinula edodes]